MKSTMATTSIIMTMLLILQKVGGLLREGMLANYYGTSPLVDAFLMAESIGAIAMALMLHFASPYTPIYAGLAESGKTKEAKTYQDTMFTSIAVLGILSALGTILLSRPLIRLLAPGYVGEVFEKTVQFYSVMVWGQLLKALSTLLVAYLHYRGCFVIPRVCYVWISLTDILVIWLSVKIDPDLLPWSFTAGFTVFFVGILAASIKRGYRPKPCLRYTENIRETILMVLPGLFSLAISYINTIIDKNFASTLPSGTVSAFSYANVLYESIYAVITTAILTVVTPKISKLVARKDTMGVNETVRFAMTNLLILLIPITFGGILLRKEIVMLLYQRGAFDAMATLRTSGIFAMYVLCMTSRAIRTILSHVVYSHKRSVILTVIGLVCVLINMVLNFLWRPIWAHMGLAAATAVAGWVITPWYIVINREHLQGFKIRLFLTTIFKSLVSAGAMTCAVLVLQWLMPDFPESGMVGQAVHLVLYAGVGAAVYAAMAFLLKIQEVQSLVMGVFKKGKALLGARAR